ncbi:hypothetical protein DESAMIL20_1729 [Desulfurella amilsii]|uniref:Uncharacterized protein n=1 Tax=Desulfurella amilsii TaxID=1562698 RepID=A0A1X4XXC0_9BACT|nr:hypothetical protein DESAMIL20_1729 [Desulfurella amilsii]
MPFNNPMYKNKKKGTKATVVIKSTFANTLVFFRDLSVIKSGTKAKKETKE